MFFIQKSFSNLFFEIKKEALRGFPFSPFRARLLPTVSVPSQGDLYARDRLNVCGLWVKYGCKLQLPDTPVNPCKYVGDFTDVKCSSVKFV